MHHNKVIMSDLPYTLTFVTSYLIDKEKSPTTDEWHVDRLCELVSIGIPLYIYVSKENAENVAFLHSYTNVQIDVIDTQDLWVFRELHDRSVELPQSRNLEKDTAHYLSISHSKPELVHRVIELNPWKTSHFAYIDYNITYLFHEKAKTYDFLRQMSKRSFTDKMLIFPGCSQPIANEQVYTLANYIYWRFCGGFFIGDKETLSNWWVQYQSYFVEYINTYNTLTWDVNFWAWMENVKRWEIRWYGANHNDSIITSISADFLTTNLLRVSRRVKHNYPVISQFRPTSASYIKTPDGRRWLNTRYVNYWLYNNGCYGYPTRSYIIENKNMLCELDAEMCPLEGSFVTVNEVIDLPKYPESVFSQGLEDVRLYLGKNNNVQFIATNVDYSPNGKNNMVIGDYSVDTQTISDVRVILPPTESWCEKNWIPITLDENPTKFIYKWSPMEIGQINESTGSLEIVQSYDINAPYFHKVRGSTTFMDSLDGLLGVVHFSEDHNPRHYYHILVLLDKETLRPLKYSNCFCFKSLGVEFCIGFTDELDEYVFWISQMDRDPMTVFIPKLEIPLCFDF